MEYGVSLGEFELIARYFRDLGSARKDVVTGVGDDAAVLETPPGMQLVAAVDAMVEAVHFPKTSEPRSIGHRALAVNLSDIAAMGARPAWTLLALTLPKAEEPWLGEFARGFDELAKAHGVSLVGGDTTRGPLTVVVQVLGFVPEGAALLRSGGRPGDVLCVTGTPGDAAAGLALEEKFAGSAAPDGAYLRARFLYPQPRCELGELLRGHATACIDVSDGLAADAGKLAAASGCGVRIDLDALPLSAPLVRTVGEARARVLALEGGDDYELLFTVTPSHFEAFERALPARRHGWRRIGELLEAPGVATAVAGAVTQFSSTGYDHFRGG
jgi:thiamine-monophosphate kinase